MHESENEVAQLCPTLRDPMGSSIHGTFQARGLEWGASAFSAGDLQDAVSIPGLGRSPGEGNGNPLQYSCLKKSHGQRSLAGYRP